MWGYALAGSANAGGFDVLELVEAGNVTRLVAQLADAPVE